MLDFLSVLVVSAMPFSELRGGIPLGLAMDLRPETVFLLALIGNILPVPVILLFLNELKNIFCKIGFFDRMYRKIEKRVLEKKDIIDKYGYLGLTLFVAIPLPVTGAWTGSLLAFLLEMDFRKAFFHISLGVLIAGIIVMLASLGVITIFNFGK